MSRSEKIPYQPRQRYYRDQRDNGERGDGSSGEEEGRLNANGRGGNRTPRPKRRTISPGAQPDSSSSHQQRNLGQLLSTQCESSHRSPVRTEHFPNSLAEYRNRPESYQTRPPIQAQYREHSIDSINPLPSSIENWRIHSETSQYSLDRPRTTGEPHHNVDRLSFSTERLTQYIEEQPTHNNNNTSDNVSPLPSRSTRKTAGQPNYDLRFRGRPIHDKYPVVLITNASKGEIGNHLARQFYKQKCRVICLARQLEDLSDLQGDIYDKITTDILIPENLERVFKYIQDKYPRIDMVIITPSVDVLGPLSELDRFASPESATWQAIPEGEDFASLVFRANLLVPLFIAQRIASLMITHHLTGTIGFVGSILGDIPSPWSALFSSSMAALHALANSLRLEIAPYHIKVFLFKMGYDKSMVVNNNIRGLYFPINSIYKTIETFIYYRAVWNRREIESRGKYFSYIVAMTCMNRHRSSYLVDALTSPTHTLLTLGTRFVTRLIPELEPHLNYFSPQANPHWPCPEWEFVIGGEFSGLRMYYPPSPHLFQDWFRWDWLGIGYLTTTPLLPSAHPSDPPPYPAWHPPPLSGTHTLVSDDASSS